MSEHETKTTTAASELSQDDVWSLGQLDFSMRLLRLYEIVILLVNAC